MPWLEALVELVAVRAAQRLPFEKAKEAMPVEQTPRTRMDAPLPATPEPEPEPAPNGIHHATTSPYRTGRRAPEAIGANPLSNALCTDMYQITMAYSFWFNNRHDDEASYDLFFRKNPFGGEYTVFCGLEECVRLVSNFGFTPEQIAYLRSVMPECGDDFFDWLGKLDCSGVRVYALQEGTVCFPRIPLLRVEGPLAICQMLETPLLNCVNYPTLVATNAARLKVAAGEGKGLLETGLRRAQGPDGAVSGSRYAFIGGFDGTSNVQAGMMFSILPKGAHAHSYVMSYSGLEELQVPDGRTISTRSGETADIVAESLAWQGKLGSRCGLAPGHQGELAAFCAYARANPTSFLALVDSYDTLKSGLVNFLAVSLALHARLRTRRHRARLGRSGISVERGAPDLPAGGGRVRDPLAAGAADRGLQRHLGQHPRVAAPAEPRD